MRGTDRRRGQGERVNQMGREADTESHDLHRIHRASHGRLPIWLFSRRGMHSKRSLAHDGILAFRATSRPGFSLARVKLVVEETRGCLLAAFINPGHSRVLCCGFLHFGVGWGQEHRSMMADSLGTIASSRWKERHNRRVTHSEPFFSLAGPGDLCTQKAACPSHTPWRSRKTTACRGIHPDPRTDTCAQNTLLVETQTAALEPRSPSYVS